MYCTVRLSESGAWSWRSVRCRRNSAFPTQRRSTTHHCSLPKVALAAQFPAVAPVPTLEAAHPPAVGSVHSVRPLWPETLRLAAGWPPTDVNVGHTLCRHDAVSYVGLGKGEWPVSVVAHATLLRVAGHSAWRQHRPRHNRLSHPPTGEMTRDRRRIPARCACVRSKVGLLSGGLSTAQELLAIRYILPPWAQTATLHKGQRDKGGGWVGGCGMGRGGSTAYGTASLVPPARPSTAPLAPRGSDTGVGLPPPDRDLAGARTPHTSCAEGAPAGPRVRGGPSVASNHATYW